MPIVRGHHAFESHFTQIPNAWLRDTRLSYKARGLLAELMTHAPGFQVSRERLARNGQDGDRAVRSAIAELEAAGYLKRSQSRSDGQRFGAAVWVTCDPSEPSVRFAPAVIAPADDEGAKKTEVKKTEVREVDLVRQDVERANKEAFEEFWKVYPRRQARGGAYKAFIKAAECVPVQEILEGSKRFASDPYLPPKQFIPMAATWLNQERWSDGPLPERELTPEEKAEKARAKADREREAARIENARRMAESEETKRRLAENPVPHCKHDRIVYACTKCAPAFLKQKSANESALDTNEKEETHGTNN